MTIASADKNANKLDVTYDLDIGRECIFILQFTSGRRRRVQAFYRQAIPCFCLDVLISEKKEVYIYVKGHLTYNQSVC